MTGVRPVAGTYVLTSGGKFAGKSVSLAPGSAKWAQRVEVVDGDIVLTTAHGLVVIFR